MDNKANNLLDEFPPVSREEWEEVIARDLKGADYKTKLKWNTGEGIEALPFYMQDDFDELPSPISVKQNDWEIRQPVTEQNVSEANAIAKNALENGADSLEFTVEVRSTEGMLGGDFRGSAIQNQEAFSKLLDGIDLTETSLHFDSGMASPILLAMLHNEIEERAIDNSSINGSVLYDPYAFIITNGQLPARKFAHVETGRQMLEFSNSHLPNFKSLGIDARVYHQTGGTVVQELGYALAAGSEYLATLSEVGTDTNTIASAIHFNFSIGSNYFLEIAKFRAARKLWRSVLDAYEVDNQNKTYLHGSSSNWNKTIYDAHMNMLRSTTEGMAAAIAGCDSITLHTYDAHFRPPDKFSRRIARNCQIILKEESYFNKVADPGAGSYYIEKLTDKIAEAAWNCFQEVETQGGMLKSIKGGYIQTAVEESRKERDQTIAKRGRIFVGVNQYPNSGAEQPETGKAGKPVNSLNETDAEVSLAPEQLMTSLKEALQNGAALGDIISVLFDFTKLDVRILRPYRGAQAFEALRQATEKHTQTPSVLTLPMGDKKMRKARSSFAVNFFGCVGYNITDPIGFDSIDEATEKLQAENPDIVVLCSSDEEYKELVPALCEQLDKLDQQPIVGLAGYPKEHIELYKEAGVDSFIHAQCNVLETLKDFQKKLGVIKNEK